MSEVMRARLVSAGGYGDETPDKIFFAGAEGNIISINDHGGAWIAVDGYLENLVGLGYEGSADAYRGLYFYEHEFEII